MFHSGAAGTARELRVDILTGLMIWAVEATTLALLLSRWFYERERFYLSWGGGFALHGLGIILIALRGEIPDFISVEIANTVLLAGMGLWIAGLLQFDHKPVEPYIAIPALIWIAGMFLNPVRESFVNRVALHNLAVIVCYGIMIGLLLKPSPTSWMTRRVLAGLLAIQSLANGLIAVITLGSGAATFGSASNAPWLFIPAAFCFIAGIMSAAKMLNERAEDKLKALAVTDPLTGVLNRRGLIEEFHKLRHVENRDKPVIALLHFDLDSFKQINDLYGHQAGDAVLVAFSKICQTSLRGRGHFGRMGGEEFASILRVGDMVEAASIAEAIRLTLKRQPILVGEHSIAVTVSAGIALAVANSADLDLLLSSADRALYAAKENGRDRTAVGNGADVSIVPAIDREDEMDMTAGTQATGQVAALKRLAALGK
jgi:diguanylate cyclase (GGDEF)-like protein